MTPQEFYNAYHLDAEKNEVAFGVPWQVTLAQAALESGWGRSGLAAKYNNFFGIKADPSWTGPTTIQSTREVINGKEVYINAGFRVYATPQGSFADHARFLKRWDRYKSAFTTRDPKVFATRVANAGYATDPGYAKALHKLIDDFNKMAAGSPTPAPTVPPIPKEPAAQSWLKGLLMSISKLFS